MPSISKIDSLTRQPIPFDMTALRPSRYSMPLRSTLRHDSLNDATKTKAAAAPSTSGYSVSNCEAVGGVDYHGLSTFASLSLAVSESSLISVRASSILARLDWVGLGRALAAGITKVQHSYAVKVLNYRRFKSCFGF